MHGVDVAVFRWINGQSEAFQPLFAFLSEGSKQGWVRAGFLLLVVAMVWRGARSRKAALLALVAFPLANGITDVLKYTFHMRRPCVELPDVISHGVPFLGSYGTASAHSANMAAVAFVLVYHLKWWGAPWILVAFLTGVSRVYVGVHYPSQVLLGWACGILAAFVVVKTWEAFVKARCAKDGEQGTEACN